MPSPRLDAQRLEKEAGRGADDPVTQMGKGPRALLPRLQKLGLATAQIEYPQLRHEILNEANRAQVFDDIVRLIQA